MSFSENEFPSIIKNLKKFQQKYKSSPVVEKIVQELWKNYEIIPIYPGLVSDTINRMVKEINISQIKKGDWVCLEINNKRVGGYVKEINDKGIILENVMEVSTEEEYTIDMSQIKNVIKINEEQLKEDWPMLIFEKEE